MDTKIGRAKGSIFLNSKDYIVNSIGDSVWKLILANLPEDDSEFLEKNIAKTEWYPVTHLNGLVNTYDLIVGNGDFLSIVPVAEYIAKKDLGPVFEVFVDLKNPQVIVNSAPSLWSRYFDTGRVEVERVNTDDKSSTLVLYELADETRASGVAICTFAVPEWFKTGLLMSGTSSVTVTQTECRYKGAESCRYEIKWE